MKFLRKIARAWRLILVIIIGLALIGALGWGIYAGINKIFFGGKLGDNGPVTTRQVLVSVHDFSMPDPVADRKSSIKLGYVLGVYPEDHEWSDTEKISFLILKMKLNDTQAAELTQPVEKNIDPKTLPQEQQDQMKKDKNTPAQKETVAAREYKIDLSKIGFTGDVSLAKGQPFLDKVFDWSVVQKISN